MIDENPRFDIDLMMEGKKSFDLSSGKKVYTTNIKKSKKDIPNTKMVKAFTTIEDLSTASVYISSYNDIIGPLI